MCPLLGIFPSFESLGGVERSGRVAWTGIEGRLFSYARNLKAATGDQNGSAVHAHSKPGAILEALRRSWPERTVLIWHLGLLQLVPFLRVRHAQVALFLHGIEAWRRHGPVTQAMLRRVDLFLTNSEYTWDRFVNANQRFRSAAHETVHLGLDSAVQADPAAPDTTPSALMLGRMARRENYKGHREMITAWPQVLERIPNAQLWIAGGGDLRVDLERLAVGCGVAGRVQFLGIISEEEKQRRIARSRCLVMPSRGEGFGLVYLEGMRLGRPCLVSTVDAGLEVVNPPEAGLAADPSDRDQLADSVCRLLTEGPEWEQWSQRARLRYEERFTAAHFQQRLRTALATLERAST